MLHVHRLSKPLRTVFCRDMLGVGVLMNVLATFVALMMASQCASAWVAAAIDFAPLPFNGDHREGWRLIDLGSAPGGSGLPA